MNSINNYAEYLTIRKTDSKILLRKILLVVSTMGGALVISTLFFKPLIYAIPLIWLAAGILLWYLWRYVKIEYEYTVASGEISFDVIYGQKARRRLLTARLNEMEIIAPATETYRHRIEAQDINKRLFYCSSLDAPNVYFMQYSDKKDGKVIIFFDATKKTISALKYYNPANTYVGEALPF